MAGRRSTTEIAEVRELYHRTNGQAHLIEDAVNPPTRPGEPQSYIHVEAGAYWNVKAAYQREVADDLVVSFRTKDVTEAHAVARAIRAALEVTR